MIVISFLNEKGGVGKTTLATHIAAGLAVRGARVILVDADAQGNATHMLGARKRAGLYNLLVREGTEEAEWRNALEMVNPAVYSPGKPAGQLFVVPSNLETRNIANSIQDGLIFRRRFGELDGVVDVIVVDTSPTPSLLHASIFAATDYVYIPTQLEAASTFEGVESSIANVTRSRDALAAAGLNAANISGIIPNMYRANTSTHSVTLEYLQERYGRLVWEPITQRIIYAEAAMARQLVIRYAPRSEAAIELWKTVFRVERLIQHEQEERSAGEG